MVRNVFEAWRDAKQARQLLQTTVLRNGSMTQAVQKLLAERWEWRTERTRLLCKLGDAEYATEALSSELSKIMDRAGVHGQGVPSLDRLEAFLTERTMPEPIRVLDHGYVRLVEDWGRGDAGVHEAGIIEAARQSTQGAFRGWDEDRKLLRYLSANRHDTPFEFAGMVLEIRAPIFVVREWHRHRTQSYNEMSARYAPLPDLCYVPSKERLMMGAGGTNRQAGTVRGADTLTAEAAEQFMQDLMDDYVAFEASYQLALQVGVPKELARLGMPVGLYTQMRASANLRNWLAFVTLRSDPAAQWEIRQFSNAVGELISLRFPETWECYAAKVRN